mmetsp:Transcript_10407/g.26694  ORF Transcript_10407/g.26694 Transcript_10407/m.26694 type:complete len:624 (+) Transcript_10407:85-1956(+)
MAAAAAAAAADMQPEDHLYTTEVVTATAEPDDSFTYTSVPVTDVPQPSAAESLQDTLQQVRMAEVQNAATSKLAEPVGSVDRPELAQDFIRNFLLKKGMVKTFQAFQLEWYDMVQSGTLKPDPQETVPDCYVDNLRLEAAVTAAQQQLADQLNKTAAAQSTAATLKKERDFHRISHRRVKEEKRNLLATTRRAEAHAEEMQTELAGMRDKYTRTLRQKTTATLSLERSQKEVDEMVELSKKVLDLSMDGTTFSAARDLAQLEAAGGDGGPLAALAVLPEPELPGAAASREAGPETSMPPTPKLAMRPAGISQPARDFAAAALERQPPRLVKTFRAHDDGVSALATDPAGGVLGTASDDNTFRTWQPDGELLLEGAGHSGWTSAVTFHPALSTVAATASGDATVKLWDLSEARCTATLSGHAFAVWDVDFHCTGDFVASASLDNTVKLWDVATARCRRTLRGHSDAVNAVAFQTASNLLVSAGADRSCMLWDARLGRAIAGLRGHSSAVFDTAFSPDGAHVASVDAAGCLKLWEMKTHGCVATVNVGSEAAPANRCIFDPTGTVLAVGSEDSVIRLYSAVDPGAGPLCELAAHTDAVQGLAFNSKSGHLYSGSADGTVRTWVME